MWAEYAGGGTGALVYLHQADGRLPSHVWGPSVGVPVLVYVLVAHCQLVILSVGASDNVTVISCQTLKPAQKESIQSGSGHVCASAAGSPWFLGTVGQPVALCFLPWGHLVLSSGRDSERLWILLTNVPSLIFSSSPTVFFSSSFSGKSKSDVVGLEWSLCFRLRK